MTPSVRLTGIDRYKTARNTSPKIMFSRRSNRSATAPASGPSSSAGSSEVSQTPLTAVACAVLAAVEAAGDPFPPARRKASAVSARRLSQSPRLDSEPAIHSRRKAAMDSAPERSPPKGDLKFTATGYRQNGEVIPQPPTTVSATSG